jgi:hypothetical protein
MLNNYIALLPELVLFLGLICMRLVKLMRKNNTPKTFYTLSRFFLFFGAVFTAIFICKVPMAQKLNTFIPNRNIPAIAAN